MLDLNQVHNLPLYCILNGHTMRLYQFGSCGEIVKNLIASSSGDGGGGGVVPAVCASFDLCAGSGLHGRDGFAVKFAVQ